MTFFHDTEQDLSGIPDVDSKKCREAVRSFLEIERKYHVAASYNVVGKLFETQPDIINWIESHDQEVAFHSYSHRHDVATKNLDYRAEIEQCRKVSPRPKGYRSPRGEFTQDTIRSLWENGFLWNAEGVRRTEPFFVYAGLVQLPIAMDDWLLYAGPRQRNKPIDVNEWLRRFSNLLDTRRYIAVGLHDSVASLVPEVMDAYERAVRITIEKKALMASFWQTADLFRRRVLADFYSTTAKSWNESSKTTYRTKRFQEIVRSEATRIASPIIADLGSGGGLLTSGLKDVAREIYCVDNAPGMIGEIDSIEGMRLRLGEVTDSGLPDSSVDLVICARVIEYLFDPDHLAEEIARIAKQGGTFIVTFPAKRGTSNRVFKAGYNSPDQRIRRYFAPEEIKLWADQIGTGRLIGVQYDAREPNTKELEQQYRDVERNPPLGAQPTNWVYIGRVQNEDHARKSHQTALPFSAFEFRNREEIGFKDHLIRVGLKFPRPIRKIGRVFLAVKE
jgi:SAM-dependent methyltransferase/peptidoglycan/xylan/chitin deacetylase (PgdA/CDA1 family)